MRPKEFLGTSDPMAAEGWIKSLEVIFEFMGLEDGDRVRCATYLFGGEARLWWEGAFVALDLASFSWTRFIEVFYSKYFTEEVRSRLTTEFMTSRQGDLTVTEFIRKFERGCHFVPLIANDDGAKLRHFLNDQNDIERDRQGKRPFQAPHLPPQQHHQNKRHFHDPHRNRGPQQQQQGRAFPRTVEYPVCENCSRRHAGTCMYGSEKCYKCGSTDHILKNCPQNNLPTQGRVFALHAVETNPETMLMTETMANSLKIKTNGLDIAYSVALPSGEEMTATNRHWLELVEDYDCDISYHPGKADVVADALSRKVSMMAHLLADEQLAKWKQRDEAKGSILYTVRDSIVRYRDRIWVPNSDSI
ncbi:uncharacterized protein [Primulina eburnea]|uniref:uncharacterized protein n=1 Tax=Primulina eburnea TaxID=1245227 RepID=UPI003C6BEFE3